MISRAGRPFTIVALSLDSHYAKLLSGRRVWSLLNSPPLQQCLGSQRRLHTDSALAIPDEPLTELLELPRSCPGCGAFTQLHDSAQAGFYSPTRKSVAAYLTRDGAGDGSADLSSTPPQSATKSSDPPASSHWISHRSNSDGPPLCDRCHQLTHHSIGSPIQHPTLQALADIIRESPFKHNHIYHIIDAADFPLSLIPSIQRRLSINPQRSRNRRAKSQVFRHGGTREMSFVITRSDLLAPRKEQVDGLMPYIAEVIREALQDTTDNVRLGNVRCVSAKRGWWTSRLKEEIWERGGAGWMVGKINVGKSNLLETVFPKGRTEGVNGNALRQAANNKIHNRLQLPAMTFPGNSETADSGNMCIIGGGVEGQQFRSLPPARAETAYPVLPLVSSLPGTTVLPIRLPFGNGKGELIDLPGLDRGHLEYYVKDEYRDDLIMQRRLKPHQVSIMPGQSLLVGGLVRITPLSPDLTFLAYPFVPLRCHVASTDRIISIHTQTSSSETASVAKPGTGHRMSSAGRFSLKWDVTKQRAGPLTRKDAAGLNPDTLPFIVFSTDVLIEGCGWIELVVQARRKNFANAKTLTRVNTDANPYPQIQVFSPGGRHVGVRRPMNAWLLNVDNTASTKPPKRPRRSMKGAKKRMKHGQSL